jgi:hypothetical protein
LGILRRKFFKIGGLERKCQRRKFLERRYGRKNFGKTQHMVLGIHPEQPSRAHYLVMGQGVAE